MKAIVYKEYGSPDLLRLEEVEKPIPNDDQLLVKMHASSVNPLDWHKLRGEPFLVRLADGIRRPKRHILGADIAGEVIGMGKDVNGFKIGDAVFGEEMGGFAEYAVIRAKNAVLKPENISFAEAAAVPVAGLTALQAMHKGKLQAGQSVLINGASGGVGTYAVQIAKGMGAEVTAVCSGRNRELVLSIGADHHIDYTKEDFTQNGKEYDLIVDAVANHTITDYKRLLKEKGICVIVGFSPALAIKLLFLSPIFSRMGGKQLMLMLATANQEDMLLLQQLLESGQLHSVIDRTYPLEEVADAIRYLETSRARGKVIVEIDGFLAS